MNKGNLNGSVDVLARAMRDVFSEAVEGAVERAVGPVKGRLDALSTDVREIRSDVQEIRTDMHEMETRLNQRIDTTNANMQAQFAEQQKQIGQIETKIDSFASAGR